MTIFCSVMNHVASPKRQHNQGLEFSMCHRCGCDLIRIEASGEWSQVPQGFRVVWRDGAAPAQRPAPPPRRQVRNARPVPRRDPRGRPFAAAASMVSMFANLRRLVAGEPEDRMPAMDRNGQYVIRLPGVPQPVEGWRSFSMSPAISFGDVVGA